jgi:hypothetical protein
MQPFSLRSMPYVASLVAAAPVVSGINYAGAQIQAGAYTDAIEQQALATFEARLLAGAILSNVSRSECLDAAMYLVVGGTSARHAINFIDPNQWGLTFYGSPLHSSQGIHWNGNQHADTGLAASSLDKFQAGLACYVGDNTAGAGDTIDIGAQGNGQGLFISTANGLVGGRPYARVSGGDVPVDSVAGPGLYTTTTAPSTGMDPTTTRFLRNGQAMREGGGTPNDLSTNTVFLGALNLGYRYGGSTRRGQFYAIRQRSYTQAQELILSAAVQELQTTLNRAAY